MAAKKTGADDATSPWRKSVFTDFFSRDFTKALACCVEAKSSIRRLPPIPPKEGRGRLFLSLKFIIDVVN